MKKIEMMIYPQMKCNHSKPINGVTWPDKRMFLYEVCISIIYGMQEVHDYGCRDDNSICACTNINVIII